ncbi:hypothetical protein [Sorangium sp. So ce406]|uniref:hypothetical protein n=1 Tax=Sorangium sp. So ce406 TaxID=3133311 RepID=UPI003F5C72A1
MGGRYYGGGGRGRDPGGGAVRLRSGAARSDGALPFVRPGDRQESAAPRPRSVACRLAAPAYSQRHGRRRSAVRALDTPAWPGSVERSGMLLELDLGALSECARIPDQADAVDAYWERLKRGG